MTERYTHDEAGVETRPEPTILETQLDSISLTLAQMKSRLYRSPMLDHISEAERAELNAALARAEGKMNELSAIIRNA